MRVDDIRPEAPRGAAGVACERHVPEPASAAPVDDGALELVSPRPEGVLELLHEDAQVGILGTGVHLRDEQDPQRAPSLAGVPQARCAS